MFAALLLVLAGVTLSIPGQEIRFGERVDVERVVVDARAVDGAGRPILGLTPQDFRVRVNGSPVALESAQWVSGAAPAVDSVTANVSSASGEALAPTAASPPRGRLIVLFFQKELHHSRLTGLLTMMRRAARLVDGLGEHDRVAVLSFDTHLKLWLDFTRDREAVRRIAEHSLIFEDRPREVVPGDPSLAAQFDVQRGREAASPEEGLLVTAEALGRMPGAKSLVLFGFGFGTFSPGVGVHLSQTYEDARRALTEARVTVFALDITNADAHSLEFGLQQVAEDTGGFFARTHLFPAQALQRLERALHGYYVLTFVKPVLPPGEHALDIRLSGRKGNVLAKRSYRG